MFSNKNGANLSNPARFANLKLGDYEGKLAIQLRKNPKSSLMESKVKKRVDSWKDHHQNHHSHDHCRLVVIMFIIIFISSSTSASLSLTKKTQGSQGTAIIVSGANVRVAKCCVRHKPVILTWMRIELVPEGPSAPDHFLYNLEGFRAHMKWSSWRYKETLEKDDLQQY